MKKMIICTILIIVLQWVIPLWWWVLAVPLVFCYFSADSNRQALFTGFLGAGLARFVPALMLWFGPARIISGRVAVMMQLDHGWQLLGVSFLIAAFAGGLGGSTGFMINNFFKTKKSYIYSA